MGGLSFNQEIQYDFSFCHDSGWMCERALISRVDAAKIRFQVSNGLFFFQQLLKVDLPRCDGPHFYRSTHLSECAQVPAFAYGGKTFTRLTASPRNCPSMPRRAHPRRLFPPAQGYAADDRFPGSSPHRSCRYLRCRTDVRRTSHFRRLP